MLRIHALSIAGSAMAATLLFNASATAGPLAMNDPREPFGFPGSIFQQVLPEQQAVPDDPVADESAPAESSVLPDRLQRQIVAYPTTEHAGTIVIDTPHTYLYYVLGDGRAIRYGIGVGRDGFRWSGVQTVARKQEWPDWYPPASMIARQPYLPRMMSGGPGNPLGARAMYLGSTEYRIHGTNDPTTIGKRVSSGCIRLTNQDVEDLYNRVTLGTKVVVLPDTGYRAERAAPVPARQQRVSSNDVQRVSSNDVPRPPMSISPRLSY